MAGRTLLQQALPVTFGLKAATWLTGLDEAGARLDEVRRTRLAVQFGGAAGTLASTGEAGPEVLAHLAGELGLAEPVLPWHTIRTRPADLGGALGAAAGVIAKAGRDVVLLAQTEVGEVREGVPGRGGSSTLPHKQNPVAAISAVAAAMRAPGLVATLLGAMAHEHERAAGPWHAEWRPFSDLLETVGSAAAWLRDCLEHLEVDAARMRANLGLTHGALLAERVTTALAGDLGRHAAHEVVQAAAREAFAGDRPLADVLAATEEVSARLDPAEIARLLDPAGYLGATDELIRRALRAHRAHRERGARAL
jgi:3-carboxy-cis,cis-muconate cycloisomerase